MPKRRNTRSKKTTQACLSTTLPPVRDQVETVSPSDRADDPPMTTRAAGVYHGLPSPSTTTTCASSSLSALPPLLSVSEPQSASSAAKAKARETACLVFVKLTSNLEERIIPEETNTNQSHKRTNLERSFAIEDFGDVMAHVEEVEEGLNIAHDVKMAMLEIRGKNGEGVDFQLEERMETVASACRSVELFNLDKRFGFSEEDTRQIVAQAESWSGRKLDREPKTLRQIFNDPMSLLEADTPTKMEKRPKSTNFVALLKFRRLSKLALQDVQAVQKIVTEKSAELPLVPTTAMFRGCLLSDTVPEKIRQSAYDLQFIKENMMDLHDQLLLLRETIRDAMLIWITAGSAAWEYGTAHIHEYPNMKKYEYLRTTLQADNLLAHREEHKILSYFLSSGRSEGVCPELQTKLSKDGQDLNMLSKDWDDRKQRLMDGFLPVEEMVKRLNALNSLEFGEANTLVEKQKCSI